MLPVSPLVVDAADSLRNLRRLKLSRIAELTHDLDDGALSALGGNARRGKQIDAFLLIKRSDHNLKLRIGQQTANAENSRRQHLTGRRCREGANRSRCR